jgi:hypothetical protein
MKAGAAVSTGSGVGSGLGGMEVWVGGRVASATVGVGEGTEVPSFRFTIVDAWGAIRIATLGVTVGPSASSGGSSRPLPQAQSQSATATRTDFAPTCFGFDMIGAEDTTETAIVPLFRALYLCPTSAVSGKMMRAPSLQHIGGRSEP